ncbi:MAG: type II secretion system protein [Verrucomicrobium sp.]
MRCHPRGFSLLEMMMVMFILSLLLGAIFGVVRSTLELSNDMTQAQTAEGRLHSFTQYCERTFRNLPAGTLVRLRVKQQGNHYLSKLALKGATAAFAMQGMGGSEVLAMETEEQVDGYLRVFLRTMTAKEALAWENGDGKAGRRLPLLEDVAVFEWRFFNVLSGEWEPVWNDTLPLYPLGVITANPAPEPGAPVPGPPGVPSVRTLGGRASRPQLVELRLAIGADRPSRWLFWVPPAETPTGGSGSPTPNPGGMPGPGGQQPGRIDVDVPMPVPEPNPQ